MPKQPPQLTQEDQLRMLFQWLDEYNQPDTTEYRRDRINTLLYNAGYIRRELQAFTIEGEEHTEWGLFNRKTQLFTIRPEER